MSNSVIFRCTVYDVRGVLAGTLIGDMDYLRESFKQSADNCPWVYHDCLMSGKATIDCCQIVIDDKPHTKLMSKSLVLPFSDFIADDFISAHSVFFNKVSEYLESVCDVVGISPNEVYYHG